MVKDDDDGQTVLMHAASTGNPDALELVASRLPRAQASCEGWFRLDDISPAQSMTDGYERNKSGQISLPFAFYSSLVYIVEFFFLSCPAVGASCLAVDFLGESALCFDTGVLFDCVKSHR